MKKILVFGIILLLIGIAFAPSINFNVAKASSDNEMVEVTTQACGIKGYDNTTVKLTKQQYKNLENYLNDFRERLNQTTTREEAVPIFNEAVVELNKYGLLPKGMSIKQAQKLVTNSHLDSFGSNLIKKLYTVKLSAEDENFYCLIAGAVDVALILPHNPLVYSIMRFLFNTDSIFWLGFLLLLILNIYFPVKVDKIITFGSYWDQIEIGGWASTNGWVYSFGINGVKNWEGRLYGQLGMIYTVLFDYAIGATGFTGINIWGNTQYFLGSALHVKLGPYPPG